MRVPGSACGLRSHPSAGRGRVARSRAVRAAVNACVVVPRGYTYMCAATCVVATHRRSCGPAACRPGEHRPGRGLQRRCSRPRLRTVVAFRGNVGACFARLGTVELTIGLGDKRSRLSQTPARALRHVSSSDVGVTHIGVQRAPAIGRSDDPFRHPAVVTCRDRNGKRLSEIRPREREVGDEAPNPGATDAAVPIQDGILGDLR